MRKTYYAPGLLDLQLVLHAGKAWTTVHFTGGRLSGYGDYRASFTTDDTTLQALIEKSRDFLSGRIRLATQNIGRPADCHISEAAPYPTTAHRGPGRPRKYPVADEV